MSRQMNNAIDDLNIREQPIDHRLRLLDHLPTDHLDMITKIAADLDMEPAEVLAWAVDLLTRYVAAGGEP